MPLEPETRDVLRKAKGLVAESWWHGPGNSGHCASTAVFASTRDWSKAFEVNKVLADALGVSGLCGIYAWNDAPGRTQEEVVALFDKVLQDNSKQDLDLEATADAVAVCAA